MSLYQKKWELYTHCGIRSTNVGNCIVRYFISYVFIGPTEYRIFNTSFHIKKYEHLLVSALDTHHIHVAKRGYSLSFHYIECMYKKYLFPVFFYCSSLTFITETNMYI